MITYELLNKTKINFYLRAMIDTIFLLLLFMLAFGNIHLLLFSFQK